MKQKMFFIVIGLSIGLWFSSETTIYAQPELVREQAQLLNNCMSSWDKSLDTLADANTLLAELTEK
jgi:hypothetical protein